MLVWDSLPLGEKEMVSPENVTGVYLLGLAGALSGSIISSFVKFLMVYNIMRWNIRGAVVKGMPLLLKDIVMRHNVSCLATLEPRVIAGKIPSILKTIGFDDFFVVEAEGFSCGI